MHNNQATNVAAAEAEVKRLRKRVQYWSGRVTAELNKLARAEYLKATEPDSDAAFMLCPVTLQNMRTMADNYRAVAFSFASRLRKAEDALATILTDPPQAAK